MKQITFTALALIIGIVSFPQSRRQPSAGITKKVSGASAQLAKDAHDKQQAAEIAALNSMLAATAKSEQERTQERQQETAVESENNHLQRWIIGVGIIQTLALIGTLIAVIYQSKETAKATQAMCDSLPLQKSAADAALLNAQAAVSAARPWISFFGTYNSGIFIFKAANLGKTPAEVVSYTSDMMIVDRVENLPIPPRYGKTQIPPFALLTPSQRSDGANITLTTFDTNGIAAPDPQKQTFVFFFSLVYKNPLTSADPSIIPQHESRMCFWYENRGGGFPQAGGPQEYNKHT